MCSGKELEQRVEELLVERFDVDAIHHSKWNGLTRPILLKNVPYTSIYGSICRTEFSLLLRNKTVRIECKVQNHYGSADEKFPYLMENLLYSVHEDECWVILSGDGFRESALNWLYKKAEGTKVKVFTFTEFVEGGLY